MTGNTKATPMKTTIKKYGLGVIENRYQLKDYL